MPDERIALVLAGGGARGAYEAGALTVLLPELERRGQRPTMGFGTSVGALNAAVVAATAHRPAEDVAELPIETWSSIAYDEVLQPLASPASAGRLVTYLAQALGLPRPKISSNLDPSPPRRTLPERIDFPRLRRNVS